MSVLNRMVLGLGGLAVFFWLASYSWIVGLALPTHWIWPDVSPWLIAELAAVVVGAVSLCAGLLLAWRSPSEELRRTPLLGAVLGGVAMALSLLSLVATV